MGTALQVLFSVGILVGGIWSLVWIHMTLAELRRGQRRLQADLIKLGRIHGVELGPPTIVCHNCGTEYDAELTGCSTCGEAKRADERAQSPSRRETSSA